MNNDIADMIQTYIESIQTSRANARIALSMGDLSSARKYVSWAVSARAMVAKLQKVNQ